MTATETEARLRDRLTMWLSKPVDARGLGVFRAGFGLLMAWSMVRFAWMGWIDTIWLEPAYHFTYSGLSWVMPLPAPWMYMHVGVVCASALGIMFGWRTRLMASVFFVSFTWLELIEKAAYLNHYYLVSLLALLLVVVPTSEAFSLKRGRSGYVPQWATVWCRAQMCVVYGFAGIAKIHPDWLLHGEPLYTWLQVHADWPIVGKYLLERWVAVGMSWGGMCFDVSAGFLLWHTRTRRMTYAIAVVFHVMVWMMFPIGMFSWIMIWCGTLFFAPEWPERVLKRTQAVGHIPSYTMHGVRWAVIVMTLWMTVQLAIPMRHVLYPGQVNWTERGFRFAWRVMLIEKTGQIDYRVEIDDGPMATSTRRVYPRTELTPLQYRMLCTQPDMMLEYARHIAQRVSLKEGISISRVRVYADAFVAMNGRRAQRYIDPNRDLSQLSWSEARWPVQEWVLPLEREVFTD